MFTIQIPSANLSALLLKIALIFYFRTKLAIITRKILG
jgi:hypothetical protein